MTNSESKFTNLGTSLRILGAKMAKVHENLTNFEAKLKNFKAKMAKFVNRAPLKISHSSTLHANFNVNNTSKYSATNNNNKTFISTTHTHTN